MLTFRQRDYDTPDEVQNTAYLKPDNWNDFGYTTKFSLTVFDEEGNKIEIGDIKIGFVGETEEHWTKNEISPAFPELPNHFFSLGQDTSFYENIKALSDEMADNLLTALGDVVHNEDLLLKAQNELVFKTSLLRSVSHASIEQFKRILLGQAPLTDYDFFYQKAEHERESAIKITFKIKPDSKPPSNIHILIGRNGVGKTTLLNNMVKALISPVDREETGGFFTIVKKDRFTSPETIKLPKKYFSSVVSVSFSVFDSFTPPDEQTDENTGMRYYYVGFKKRISQEEDLEHWTLKNKNDLGLDFIDSLKVCFSLTSKKNRWKKAIKTLESDTNFSDMNLCQLIDLHNEKNSFMDQAKSLFNRMSSGHAIVLLTITKLVETVEEKTLLLIDEPESHLHPPLLSAFTRALSDLLVNRNGVAIIATHSPVVLQEVPKSCVSILRRTGRITTIEQPENETFAENVGTLTREVFGLEVSKSGFLNLLKNSVDENQSYEEIVREYNDQLGFEGKLILRSMIVTRDAQAEESP